MRRDTAAARKIAELLEKVLATPLGERLTLAAEIAGQRGTRVYLVGGAVRDLYLTGEIRDLDLLVASDGVSFAGEMARRLDGRLEVHREFLTAEIVDRQGARIDLVSARTETYPEPAALPVVAPGRVEEDLARRDFTVNALAVSLDPEARFEL
ncbi:MAG: polya polymerase, partial [Thermoanaerobaculia bacterium]